MTDKIVLTDLVNLTNQTTAVNAINANNAEITTAFDNTLSRDGTQPNTMGSNLDMNNNQINNLPAPATANSPVRLQDVATLTGGGTVSSIPIGGTTDQVLAKNSNANFDAGWTSIQPIVISAGSNITITGNAPAVVATTPTPSFTTVNGSVVPPSDTLVGRSTTDTLINKTISGTSNTLTVPISTSVSGLGTGIATFLATPSSANFSTALTDETGTAGHVVFSNNPTLVTPTLGAATATTLAFNPTTGGIIGTTNIDNASTGNVGEYVETVIPVGSAVALSTGTAATIATLSLSGGDWDISAEVSYITATSTSVTLTRASISQTTNTMDFTNGRVTGGFFAATVPTAQNNAFNIVVGPVRFNTNTTSNFFLVAQGTFTAAALSAYGIIRARRIR
jgi:hypothetical protein